MAKLWHAHYSIYLWWWTEAAISSQFLCRAEGGCEFRELPLVMPPSKVCPQCNAVVPIRLKVCRNRLKFALYNADRVNFKSRNYHVVAYNISILAEGLHFSALIFIVGGPISWLRFFGILIRLPFRVTGNEAQSWPTIGVVRIIDMRGEGPSHVATLMKLNGEGY